MTNTTQPNSVYAVANGTTSTSVFVDYFASRDPTVNDVNYQIQKKWFNTTSGNYWILQNFTSSLGVVSANWVKISSALSDESLTGNTGGPVFPTANNINVVGDGTTVTVSGNPATSTLTISVIATVTWQSITTSQTLVPDNGYFVTSGNLSLALPATAAVGSVIYVSLRGGSSWTITQAAGQQIIFGNLDTTLGATGSVASTAAGDTIQLICCVANTTWQVFSSIGNLTVT